MVGQSVAAAFNPWDGGNRHTAGTGFRCDYHIFFLTSTHALHRLAETLGEGEIRNRFEHIVERVHTISSDGVLRHVGDEHDDHVAIDIAYVFGCGHAVHRFHFDIHEDDVVHAGPVVIHNIFSVGVYGDVEPFPHFSAVSPQIVLQFAGILRFVLDDGNVDAHNTSIGFMNISAFLPEDFIKCIFINAFSGSFRR